MTTKTTPADRIAAAEAAETEAGAALEAARTAEAEAGAALESVRQRAGRGATPAEHAKAVADADYAKHARLNAETDLAAAKQAILAAKLARIADDVATRWRPGLDAAIDQAAEAVARALNCGHLEPGKLVTELTAEFRALAIPDSPQRDANEDPARTAAREFAAAAGLTWSAGGYWGGDPAYVQSGGHVVKAEDPAEIAHRILAAAAEKAGLLPGRLERRRG